VLPLAQGELAHQSLLPSQSKPNQPDAQLQAYESTSSTHVPPFKQGEDAHSSTSMVQKSPAQPDAQKQA
jgi:hypothetical protein